MELIFYLTVIFFAFVTIVSAFLTYYFYKAEDGKLRKIMIGLWAAKIWLYGGSCLLIYQQHEGFKLFSSSDWWPILAVSPMFVVMLFLLRYMRVEAIRRKKEKEDK